MTEAQAALKAYYESILALERTGVIDKYHGDALSEEMFQSVGDWEDLSL